MVFVATQEMAQTCLLAQDGGWHYPTAVLHRTAEQPGAEVTLMAARV